VAAFLGDEQSANEAIADWQERYQKYKLMEQHLVTRREELKKKIPDITNTLDLVTYVIKQRVRGSGAACLAPPPGGPTVA
jgi:hypothetical protein